MKSTAKKTQAVAFRPNVISNKIKSPSIAIYSSAISNLKSSLTLPKTNKKSKKIINTIYKCGCTKPSQKELIEKNCSIEFQLIKSKSSNLLNSASKAKSSKSLQLLNKIKTVKSIDTQIASKNTLQSEKDGLKNQELNLKNVMKKIKILRKEYQQLKSTHNHRIADKSSQVKFIEKQQIKYIDRIIQVEKPIQKIKKITNTVYRPVIKQVQKPIEVFHDVEEIVYVEAPPQSPLIQYKEIVNQVVKQMRVPNPNNHLTYKKYRELAEKNMQLNLKIGETDKIINGIKKQIQAEHVRIQLQKNQQSKSQQLQRTHQQILQFARSQQLSESSIQNSIVMTNSIIVESPRMNYYGSSPNLINPADMNSLANSSLNPETKTRILTLQTSGVKYQRPQLSANKITRKYCKKNCGQKCNCMSEMVIVIKR